MLPSTTYSNENLPDSRIGDSYREKKNPKRLVVIIFLSLLFLSGAFLALESFLSPQASLASSVRSVDSDDQIVIKFSHPVARKEVTAEISPAVTGAWEFPDATFGNHLAKEMVFHPDSLLQPDTEYKITVNGIRGVVGLKPTVFKASFFTAKLPTISSLSVKNNQADVPICDPISINMSSDISSLLNIDASITPNVNISVTKKDSETFSLKPADCLGQGQNYTLSLTPYILDQKSNQKNFYNNNPLAVTFKTAMPPQVSDYSPKGSNILTTAQKFSLTFSSEMKEDYKTADIKITPVIGGVWKWENDKTLSYVFSGNLAFATNYIIEFPDRFYTISAGFTDSDLKFQFNMIGAVEVASSSPKNNSSGVSASSVISLTFDQTVDKSSAEGAFSISPSVSGKFSWSGSKMTFSPDSPLEKSVGYTVNETAPVKSIDGLPMGKSFTINFTVEDNVVTLNIPVDYQDRPLSCEAAATKMALNYKGANVSEDDIMNYVGFDPTVKNGNIWGDPYSAFVGSIDGKQNSTGYGVYWDPIAKAANHFRPAEAFTNGTAQKLATEINAGNPIVIWGTLGSAVADLWQTPDGKTINAWKGEHARTVVGYKGRVDNPSAFYINDPVKGRLIWTTSDLLGNWGAFQNSGVIIR